MPCRPGSLSRSARLYPQAVYAGPGQGTRSARAEENAMIQTQESRAQDWHRERWPELLEITSREVFQLMLGSELQPFAENSAGATLDCTAMIELARRICGMLTVRYQPEYAVRIASRM